MKIKTREDKGITLISLILTIIIIFILASVTAYTGMNTYNYSRVNKFVSQMKLLQEKADELVEDIDINDLANYIIDNNLVEVDSNNTRIVGIITMAYNNKEISSSTITDYIYFSKEDLREKLSIEDINDEIVINVKTREVVSLTGIEYEGQVYYTQYLLPGGQKIVLHVPTNSTLSFNLDLTIDGLNANVEATDMKRVYSYEDFKIITNGIIKYKLLPDDDTVYANYEQYDAAVGYWKDVSNNNQNLTISGRYVFALSDTVETTKATQEVSIKLANAPKLTDTIITKAKYYAINDIRITPPPTDGKWYNYLNASAEWAYAKDDTNYYIWIPRFAYKTVESVTIIKFLKGNSNIPTDNSEIIIDANNWIVPTKFTKYEQTLRGLWIKLGEPFNLSDIAVVDFLENTLDTNIIPII